MIVYLNKRTRYFSDYFDDLEDYYLYQQRLFAANKVGRIVRTRSPFQTNLMNSIRGKGANNNTQTLNNKPGFFGRIFGGRNNNTPPTQNNNKPGFFGRIFGGKNNNTPPPNPKTSPAAQQNNKPGLFDNIFNWFNERRNQKFQEVHRNNQINNFQAKARSHGNLQRSNAMHALQGDEIGQKVIENAHARRADEKAHLGGMSQLAFDRKQQFIQNNIGKYNGDVDAFLADNARIGEAYKNNQYIREQVDQYRRNGHQLTGQTQKPVLKAKVESPAVTATTKENTPPQPKPDANPDTKPVVTEPAADSKSQAVTATENTEKPITENTDGGGSADNTGKNTNTNTDNSGGGGNGGPGFWGTTGMIALGGAGIYGVSKMFDKDKDSNNSGNNSY